MLLLMHVNNKCYCWKTEEIVLPKGIKDLTNRHCLDDVLKKKGKQPYYLSYYTRPLKTFGGRIVDQLR